MNTSSGKKIGHHEAADYIPWNTMLRVVHELFRDKKYVMSCFLAIGSFTGLRVSDIKQLTWEMLLSTEPITLIETKTKKKRTIKINEDLQRQIIQPSYEALGITNIKSKFLISQMKVTFSTQRLNVKLKEVKAQYKMKDVPNISCHSLRKCFGRHFFDVQSEQGNGSTALCILMELFNHSSQQMTLKYLGIRQTELLNTYDCLTFA